MLALAVVFAFAVGMSTGWWLRGRVHREMDFLSIYNDHTPMSPTEAYCMGREWTGDDDVQGPLLTPTHGDDE